LDYSTSVRLLSSILLLALLSSGCTVIGFGVGLATPSSETVVSRDVFTIEPGTDVEVVVEMESGRTRSVTGRFVSADEEVIFVEAPEGQFTINRHWVRRVTIHNGTQWLQGTLVGAGIDLGLVLVVAALAARR
jgi:hypothetical protein